MSDRERFVRPPSGSRWGRRPGAAGSTGDECSSWVADSDRRCRHRSDRQWACDVIAVRARRGAHVAALVADRNEDSADETVEKIVEEGGRAFTIEGDITDEEHVRRTIDGPTWLGGLDGLV